MENVLASLPNARPVPGANVVRFGVRGNKATPSFLKYKEFFDEPIPELEWSVHVALPDGKTTRRNEGANPAILHRNELQLEGMAVSPLQLLGNDCDAAQRGERTGESEPAQYEEAAFGIGRNAGLSRAYLTTVLTVRPRR